MLRSRLSRAVAMAATLSLAMPAVVPVLAAEDDAKPYVVIMAHEPIAAYDGGVAGFAPTKAEPGKKINPRSAAVRKYEAHLEAAHAA